jgi:YfiH family protein
VTPVLTSPLLEAIPGVRHAFFTRKGGVSTGLYESLNLGAGSRDDPAAVAQNRARAAAHFGQEPARLLACYQVHSARAVIATEPWSDRPQADAVVTATPGLACAALAADCAPVLIADPVAGVIGAAHAGWRGALGGIVEATVEAMVTLGARPQRMSAAVGPCIGPQSYEVGPEFIEAFQAGAPGSERWFRPGMRPGKAMFDLPGFVLSRLDAAGVGQAEWIGRDTYAEPDEFFSNRRAVHRQEPDYGRLLSAIMIAA